MKLSGTIHNVTQTTLGSQLAADALIGDGTVTVVDGSDFNEDDGTGTGGGTLSIGGSQIDYTTIDQSTNIVTLATTLTVNASEGDRVDIVDPSTGAAALDIAAFVALPGGNGNDDFVQASVAHALALTLDQGIRDPGMGEAATIEEIHPGDGEWIVTDVRGKQAAIVNNRNQYDRLTVTFQVPDVTTWTSGTVPSWDSIDDHHGTSINVGGSGDVELSRPGVYAVNAVLFAAGNDAALANSSVRLEVVVGSGAYPAPRWAGCGLRGGDANGLGNAASCDVTYWRSGDGGVGDSTIVVYINVANLDTSAVGSILVTLSVQRIF